jgi:hypothetical protein
VQANIHIVLNGYFKEKDKEAQRANMLPPGATLTFIVNEKGEAGEVKISRPSKDEHVNKVLLDAVSKMPRWIPATDATGKPVKQEFKIMVGGAGNNSANSGGC